VQTAERSHFFRAERFFARQDKDLHALADHRIRTPIRVAGATSNFGWGEGNVSADS
jgi:hypothetical protein